MMSLIEICKVTIRASKNNPIHFTRGKGDKKSDILKQESPKGKDRNNTHTCIHTIFLFCIFLSKLSFFGVIIWSIIFETIKARGRRISNHDRPPFIQ